MYGGVGRFVVGVFGKCICVLVSVECGACCSSVLWRIGVVGLWL